MGSSLTGEMGRLDALMGIKDDKLDAAQTAAGQLPEEGRPEGLGFGGTDIHAWNFAPTVGVRADDDGDGDRDDATSLAHLQISGVYPQIWPVALDRPVEEGLDPLGRRPRNACSPGSCRCPSCPCPSPARRPSGPRCH